MGNTSIGYGIAPASIAGDSRREKSGMSKNPWSMAV
jgi:hypothetical protein